MEYLKSLIKNPLGVALVFIHWIVLVPAIAGYYDRTFNPIEPSGFHPVGSASFYPIHYHFYDEFIVVPILVMDFPAILITLLIWSPYYFIDMTDVFAGGAIATSLFTITIQWLIIGKLVSQIIDRKQQKVIEHSIFDAD